MGSRSRRKGKRGELEAVEVLREIFPAAKRSFGQSRSGSDAPDIEGTPYWVEVSIGARVSPISKLDQARSATDGRVPLVLCRRDRGEWTVSMFWRDFCDAVKGWRV